MVLLLLILLLEEGLLGGVGWLLQRGRTSSIDLLAWLGHLVVQSVQLLWLLAGSWVWPGVRWLQTGRGPSCLLENVVALGVLGAGLVGLRWEQWWGLSAHLVLLVGKVAGLTV
jgi:hypothetical protein